MALDDKLGDWGLHIVCDISLKKHKCKTALSHYNSFSWNDKSYLWKIWPAGGTRKNLRGSSKTVEFVLRAPWLSVLSKVVGWLNNRLTKRHAFPSLPTSTQQMWHYRVIRWVMLAKESWFYRVHFYKPCGKVVFFTLFMQVWFLPTISWQAQFISQDNSRSKANTCHHLLLQAHHL